MKIIGIFVPRMRTKASKTLKYILSAALAAVFLYFAFGKIEWKAFVSGLKETNWLFIGLTVVAAVAALIFRAERWRGMMLPFDGGIGRMTVWDASNIGNLASMVIPGIGEFIRCGYVRTGKAGYDKVLGTIVMERAWDILAIVLMIATAVLFKNGTLGEFFQENISGAFASRFNLPLIWPAVIAVAAAALAVLAVFRLRGRMAFCNKAAEKIEGVAKGMASFAKMDRKVLFLAYTFGIWFMYLLMTYYTIRAIPELSGLDMADALFVTCIGNIASVIPVPGGMGAYHYLVALCLNGIYGASWEAGILCATISHESHALLLIVLGAVSYFKRPPIR